MLSAVEIVLMPAQSLFGLGALSDFMLKLLSSNVDLTSRLYQRNEQQQTQQTDYEKTDCRHTTPLFSAQPLGPMAPLRNVAFTAEVLSFQYNTIHPNYGPVPVFVVTNGGH